MPRYLQRARKAARLAGKATRIAATDGPGAAVGQTFRYLAARNGMLSQQDFVTTLNQWQAGVAATLAHQQAQIAHQLALVADYQTRFAELQSEVNALRERETQVSQSLRWLAEHHAAAWADGAAHAGMTDAGPLISIVMPVWNRASLVGKAIDSVLAQSYRNWELLVVDDGSTDGSRDVVTQRLTDSRVRLLTLDHCGVSQARNHALSQSRGEIVAYLDSDNEWYPGYLAEVARTFSQNADADCAYSAQLVDDRDWKRSWIRNVRFDRDSYPETSGIDLNVFAHRRELVDRFGGFDEGLTRLVDWDLIVRYTRHRDPALVPAIGGRYRDFGTDRISGNGNFARNYYHLRRKHQQPINRDLRVLYVVCHHPQLTETYIRWEIECMRRWGVHVEVWSEHDDTVSPYPSDVPVHYGSLEDAIRTVKPHLAHVHWLNIAERYHERIARAGLQMTVRGHGFEFDSAKLPILSQNFAIQTMYVFPHYLPAGHRNDRILPMTSAFNGDLYYPPAAKDPFLVVRTASAKPAKSVKTFIDVAVQCPQHRFVLVLGVLNRLEGYAEELLEYNRGLGSPVDIRINLPTEEAAALVRKAGVYLHTYGDEEPFGMPISIAEALATGAFVLVPNVSGAAGYVGPTGAVYGSTAHAVSIIRQSARWYDEQWQAHQQRAVDYAYSHYADIDVLKPLLDNWLRIADAGIHPATIIDELPDPALQPALDYINDVAQLTVINNFDRSYLSHVVGASGRLREWGASLDVRKASLFHSIYIDCRVPPTQENRQRIRELIGERAERLAYAFCAVVFVDIEPLVDTEPPYRFRDQIAGGVLRVDAGDFEDLCLIHLAEWTEKRARCPESAFEPAVYRRIADRVGGRAAKVFYDGGAQPAVAVDDCRKAA